MEVLGGTTIFLLVCISCLLFATWRSRSQKGKEPPGPTAFPIVGNLLQIDPWNLPESLKKVRDCLIFPMFSSWYIKENPVPVVSAKFTSLICIGQVLDSNRNKRFSRYICLLSLYIAIIYCICKSIYYRCVYIYIYMCVYSKSVYIFAMSILKWVLCWPHNMCHNTTICSGFAVKALMLLQYNPPVLNSSPREQHSLALFGGRAWLYFAASAL